MSLYELDNNLLEEAKNKYERQLTDLYKMNNNKSKLNYKESIRISKEVSQFFKKETDENEKWLVNNNFLSAEYVEKVTIPVEVLKGLVSQIAQAEELIKELKSKCEEFQKQENE